MSQFKVAAAQVASVRGDLARNVGTHVAAVAAAAARGVSVLVFPELSLLGYEPDLAASHALSAADARLDPLGEAARHHRMHVAGGAALAAGGGKPAIGAVLFGPDGARRTYAKMHLGGSESHFFAPGAEPLAFAAGGQMVGLSICADSSAPAHPQAYAALGATVYAAGVFLTAEWYATDAPRLAAYAPVHRVLVVMANHAASAGTYQSVGRSAAWAPDGALLAQAAGTENALVIAARGPEGWTAEACEL
ncbi:carbon-nitrogen hydrolase family protein [Gemmata sp.]|uniref:carbon-nitrogen hydrolase family protein n=1 Tax=Gemmata sp. TaxID=1914242 RepID=UPI003F7192E3